MKTGLVLLTISFLAGIGLLLLVSSVGLKLKPELAAPIHTLSTRWLPKIPVSLPQPITEALAPTPTPIPLTAAMVQAAINRMRVLADASAIKSDSSLCPLGETILQGESLQTDQIKAVCPYCTHIVSLLFDKRTSFPTLTAYIENDATASAMINNKRLNISCLTDNETSIAVIAAQKSNPPSPAPQRLITEDELFQALAEYRRAHGAKPLNQDAKLCEYARKRVADQLKLLDEKVPKDQYPVAAKYPLDAHDGFKKDADSGVVFEMTGRQKIAENLAYWPTAQYGVHVIEWGWDSSTEGHRETQLSNDFDAVCLANERGFFAAEFGQ